MKRDSPLNLQAPTDQASRVLLIAIDAVPYGLVERLTDPELGDNAIFQGFAGPVPMISTFPSTTSLAFGGMLESIGLERSPGYECRFFDWQQNCKRGGGPISYNKLRFPWRKFFDWQSEGVTKKVVQALHLRTAARLAVKDSLAAFAGSDKDLYYIYYDLTDLIAHLKGPEGLEPFLRYLDQALKELRSEGGRHPYSVVLYSDHGIAGGNPLRNVRKDVKRTLCQAGFSIARRIRGPHDVVFVPFGLVSSFVAFTHRGREVDVATALAAAKGVDFSVANDKAGLRIVNAQGSARVLHRPRNSGEDFYAYEPLSGDPLGYAELSDAAGSWQPDSYWFEATRSKDYPDALYRIVRSFNLVKNPASVICSTESGYMFGAIRTSILSRISAGRLRWTHGAMLKGDSLGFVMSDTPGWRAPKALRFSEALTTWG